MKVEQHTTQSPHNRNSGFVSANGVARTDLAFPQRWPVRDQENKILVILPATSKSRKTIPRSSFVSQLHRQYTVLWENHAHRGRCS